MAKNDKVILAIFTLAGTAITAYFGYKAVRDTLQIPILTTQTAEARSATQTASVAEKVSFTPFSTDTPTDVIYPTPLPTVAETQLPCTLAGTCSPSDDWRQDCISKEIWSTFLNNDATPVTGLCYDLQRWGIVADDGNLYFATKKSGSRAQEYGIFTPWQDWSQIDLKINTRSIQNSEVWIGFLEEASLQSRGVIFVVQSGDTVDVRNSWEVQPIVNNLGLPDWSGVYSPEIKFDGGKIRITEGGQNILFPWSLNMSINYMFIGYRTLPAADLDAVIYDLKFIK